MNEPLAIKLRPTKIEEIIGQKHLVAPGMILYNLVKNKKLFSMILYGKPGIGKTSIALGIVNELGLRYRLLNAVINNKKDFDIVVEEAKMYGGIVLIMDEIHRMNKDKQDLLLPQIESGLITLIGMTTSNPYHSINPAIRSRCHLFELKELTKEDIIEGLNKAVLSEFLPNINIDTPSIEMIANYASFDLRYAYNLLELCYFSNNDHKIDIEVIKSLNNKKVSLNDKNGDDFFELLSALQKSIRGSDPDAAVFYLARLLVLGDIDNILRRLIVISYEDIGLANSMISVKMMAAKDATLFVGMEEARIILSNIVIEMALSPKSNSAYLAIDNALNDINKGVIGKVPKHITNHSDMYKYPHIYKNNYVKQQYLPDEIKNNKYYISGKNKNEYLMNEYHEKIKNTD